MVGVVQPARLLVRVFPLAAEIAEPSFGVLFLEGLSAVRLRLVDRALVGIARGPSLGKVPRRHWGRTVLLLVSHDILPSPLALLVGRLPLGVVRVGHLVGPLILVRALAGSLGRRALLLLRVLGLLGTLLLSALVLLVGHG